MVMMLHFLGKWRTQKCSLATLFKVIKKTGAIIAPVKKTGPAGSSVDPVPAVLDRALLPSDGCETSPKHWHRPDTTIFIDHPLGICQKILLFLRNFFCLVLKMRTLTLLTNSGRRLF
ncbi:MAG: hypothetical protein Q8L38_06045 [Pseudohongiella sp.]|nr:hypothetical protein [Pseudohongiella sp.]